MIIIGFIAERFILLTMSYPMLHVESSNNRGTSAHFAKLHKYIIYLINGAPRLILVHLRSCGSPLMQDIISFLVVS